MNAVEIEEAVSELASVPFDAGEFPFAFLAAFGNRQVTVQRLRAGSGNASDVEGGVLQRNNIHLAVCAEGQVSDTLSALRVSPKTATNKVKFILATDGLMLEAEELVTGEPLACDYSEFADHFAFFLPLAGISTIKQIKDNPVDIKATGRLNKLYIELLKNNPDWASAERRPALNHFMARLIFCMFAEDTGIFKDRQFSRTVEQMSDGANTHEIIAELFRAMATPVTGRVAAGIRSWADFPYVNGGLFSDAGECPRFSRIARTYLLRAGDLNWQEINPDIFGSMIQAVADDDERGELGMHYTSVPNILKVLNPLFLDDLRAQLEAAADSVRKLKALRRRIAAIRIFDPACGSGNFLVIAYKEMREVEHQIVRRIDDDPKSWIKLDNFYGIEIKSFAAEIARLALLIAEFQCDVRMISQQEARSMVLPLHKTGQIRVGNALRLDWFEVCPPDRSTMNGEVADLFSPPVDILEVDLNNQRTETYICGNPPYVGDKFQTDAQKSDLKVTSKGKKMPKAVDYIAGWFWKASEYIENGGRFAFVSTNSICQGVQVPNIWPDILGRQQEIYFAHTGFSWSNNANNNAQVVCIIVGITKNFAGDKYIYSDGTKKLSKNINAYLIDGPPVIVESLARSISGLPTMFSGNIARDQGNFMLSRDEKETLLSKYPEAKSIVRRIAGSMELINGLERSCLWISDDQVDVAQHIPEVRARLERVMKYRTGGSDRGKIGIETPHRFERTIIGLENQIVVPRVSSERREYIPIGYLLADVIVSDQAQAIYDAPLWNFSLVTSRIHLVWISTVCGKHETRYRYSNTLGWNTFPLPNLTEKNRSDLTRCAEDILLAREAHFPATMADLYDPDSMPDDLRHAHDRNDETLERIYIGRRFRNDTERLEKLFDLYTKMASDAPKRKGAA